MWTVLIYLLIGVDANGIPQLDYSNPIIVDSGLTETDCEIALEIIEDRQMFAREKDGYSTFYQFQPQQMAAFCEKEG